MFRGIFVLMASLMVVASAAELKEDLVVHAGAKFRVIRLDPALVQVRWLGLDEKPMRTFEKVRLHEVAEGRQLRFIMNAGIFEPGGVPSGLHVESGRERHPLNLRKGKGNFFLKPNGVLVVPVVGRARVMPSEDYPKFSGKARLAVQSGPLLLTDGERHPAFRRGSPSVKHRNGVGVDKQGRLVFAMTDKKQEANFWDFAGLFLELDCREALFLDGDISQMALNPDGPLSSNPFGAVFVVAE